MVTGRQLNWCYMHHVSLYIISIFHSFFFGSHGSNGDRFFAVHLHLRYQELATHKRVVAVVILVWVFSTFPSLFYLWVPTNISYIAFAIFWVVYLVFSAMFYIKLYLAVRRHRNQVQSLKVAPNDQLANAARLRKSAVGVFYVYLVFLLCYLPKICSFAVVVISGLISPGVIVFFSFSTTLLFFNSSLNQLLFTAGKWDTRDALSWTLWEIYFQVTTKESFSE